MKRILHFFIGHHWKKTKLSGWDYSEPHDPEYGSDYLPTQWKQYFCTCGLNKRIYHDGFTHLGVLPDRIFIFAETLGWDNLRKERNSSHD